MTTHTDQPSIRVDVLGPLRLTVDHHPVDISGPRRRGLLALLALAEGRTVTIDALREALWPTGDPDAARRALHTNVSRVRGDLGPAADRLETHPDGYRLYLDEDGLDLTRARMLLAAARAAPPEQRFRLCAQAHLLWRGPVLADLDGVSSIAATIAAASRLEREIVDALLDSAVEAGRASEVVELAARAVATDPLSEPATRSQMRVLAAVGRASDALEVGRTFRRRLSDETGLDPSPELDALIRRIAGGGAGAEPPGRAMALVAPTTRLVGREAEVAALHRLLASERLVSVVGPGGVGKTRVASEIVDRTDPTAVVPLAGHTDPASLPHALASALGLQVVGDDILGACVSYLGEHRGLLIVDNCEHLLGAVRDTIAALLARCPGTTVLTTSREPLGLPAEYVYRMSPLALVGAGSDLRGVPAVEVFLDRAARVRPDTAIDDDGLRTVADIVRRLDGMPLAIELAAGRLSTFTLDDLAARLGRALDLLGGGTPSGDARHRTLRDTLTWSYELLDDDEQRLFRHLAVWAGGVDIDIAEQVARDLRIGADPGIVLARLVDASMLLADLDDGKVRYRMLETLRAYGLDRLVATGELATAEQRLLDWAVARTGWVAEVVVTEREPEADAFVRRELANLRAAWFLARQRDTLDEASAMVIDLVSIITYRDLTELRDWARELADDPRILDHPRAAAVLGTAGMASYHSGDHTIAQRLGRAGLEMAADTVVAWPSLLALSVSALAQADHDAVVEHAMHAVAATGRPREEYGIAALARLYGGDPDEARRLNDLGMAAVHAPTLRAFAVYVAGEIESMTGRPAEAEQHYLEAIDQAGAAGATFVVGIARVGLVALRGRGPRIEEALHGYRETVEYFAATGNWTHLWVTLRNLADLLHRLGDHGPAALLEAAAVSSPEAPALGPDAAPGRAVAAASGSAEPPAVRVDHDTVLEVARRAITRHLGRHGSSGLTARDPLP